MLSRKHPDPLHAAFDNHRLMANGGLLPTSPILRLGLGAPATAGPGDQRQLDLPGRLLLLPPLLGSVGVISGDGPE